MAKGPSFWDPLLPTRREGPGTGPPLRQGVEGRGTRVKITAIKRYKCKM